jgi:hypothetical protein
VKITWVLLSFSDPNIIYALPFFNVSDEIIAEL